MDALAVHDDLKAKLSRIKKQAEQGVQSRKGRDRTMDKCSFGDGITIKADGIHALDPCLYEPIEIYKNVTVEILRCKRCGNIDIQWIRQDNTEKVVP